MESSCYFHPLEKIFYIVAGNCISTCPPEKAGILAYNSNEKSPQIPYCYCEGEECSFAELDLSNYFKAKKDNKGNCEICYVQGIEGKSPVNIDGSSCVPKEYGSGGKILTIFAQDIGQLETILDKEGIKLEFGDLIIKDWGDCQVDFTMTCDK